MKIIATIPKFRYEWLKSKVDDLRKKSTKLGLQPIQLASFPAPSLYQLKSGQWSSNKDDPNATGLSIEMLEVCLEGESPKYEGWTFLATLTPHEDRNLLLLMPGVEEDLTRYIEMVGVCEHCQKSRRRKETFIVRHDSGETKAVGRSCLKDFLGHQSPEQLANYAAALCGLDRELYKNEELQDSERLGRSGVITVSLSKWLEIAACFIRQDGFVSKKSADERGVVSTNLLVLNWLFARGIVFSEAEKEKYNPTEEDIRTAEEVKKWMMFEDEVITGYYFKENLKTIAIADYVTFKSSGWVTAGVASYLNEKADKQRKGKGIQSEYIGVIGNTITCDVTVRRMHQYDSSYGTCCMHSLETDTGNVIVWFAQNSARWLRIGGRYQITAKVKKHETYRSINQTIVSHFKVEQELPTTLEPAFGEAQ